MTTNNKNELHKRDSMGYDTKSGRWLLHFLDDGLKRVLVPLVPKSVETYHLTLTTILWSILIVFFSYLARTDINWLWAVSLMIVFQYLTDLLDGEIGRIRNTGLIKWGFYMDHFLDFIFLSSIVIGYSLLLPYKYHMYQVLIFALYGGFMVDSYLSFAATGEFRIAHYGIGPTEVRSAFILVNTFLIIFGKTYLGPAIPYIFILALVGLCAAVYSNQKRIWAIDMEKKKKKKKR